MIVTRQFPETTRDGSVNSSHRFLCVAIAFGALLATSFVFHALLPPSIPEGVAEKSEFFAKHKDEFDTLFLGSSRFYYAVSPEIFDKVTRENGLPTRTFNFGIDGMNPPENFYVLDQILKTKPRSLKWVFVEVGDIETKSHAQHSQHAAPPLLARLAAHGADAEKGVQSARHGEVVSKAQSALECAAQLYPAPRTFRKAVHQRRARGRFPALANGYSRSRIGSEPLGRRATAIGSRERRCLRSAPRNFRRKLAEEVATARPELIDPYAERAYRDCAAKIRRIGAAPIFVVPPGIYQSPMLFRKSPPPGPLLLFNDSKTYPQLYDTKVRVDDQHLTNEGAAEFTRLLALEFVRSIRRP